MLKSKSNVGILKPDYYKGKRGVVIGCGPSLLSEKYMVLRELENEMTIGVNGLMRWWNMPFVPNFMCLSELGSVNKYAAEVSRLNTCRIASFRREEDADHPDLRLGWHIVKRTHSSPIYEDGWVSGDGFEVTGGKANVIFAVAIPLAWWLGLDPIYVLGLDMGPKLHVFECMDAFQIGRPLPVWNDLEMVHATKAARRIAEKFREDGRTIINLNPDSKIDGFPFSTLEKVLRR